MYNGLKKNKLKTLTNRPLFRLKLVESVALEQCLIVAVIITNVGHLFLETLLGT